MIKQIRISGLSMLLFILGLPAFTNADSSGEFDFSLIVEPKVVRFPKEPEEFASYLTDVRMVLQTKKVESLTDYVVVQWIKGCQFETRWNQNGEAKKILSISRHHFEKIIPFQHRSWEIDSDILDPVYSSDSRFGRFTLWRWNSNPKSLDPATATFFFRSPPPHPKMFLTDLPGSAAYWVDPANGAESARNTSLEFRTCLYRTKDIPEKSDPSGSNFSHVEPLKCHVWEHKYVFNRATRRFAVGGPIDPVCQPSP